MIYFIDEIFIPYNKFIWVLLSLFKLIISIFLDILQQIADSWELLLF